MEAREQQRLTEQYQRQNDNLYGMLEQKWAPFLKGITNKRVRQVTAVVMENQKGHLQALQEETGTANVGTFTRHIFPMLRRVVPNLIANEIMSVQPMTGPLGSVFYYGVKHGNDKGSITKGDELIDVLSEFYSSEKIDEERIGLGDATAVTFTNDLKWTPVRPLAADSVYAVTVTAGAITGQDNGTGTIAGTGINGTVNYTTGAISVTFDVAPAAAAPVVVEYYYTSESNAAVPEITIAITQEQIKAEGRKLKARWSVEAMDDLRALHGINPEVELVASMANEIALEIDREMIDMLISGALINQSFTYNPAANSVGELDSIRAMLTRLSSISSKVHKGTKRAPANFIVCPPEVVALLEQLTTHGDYRPAFQGNVAAAFGPLDPGQQSSYGPLTSNFGVMRVGTLLNKWAVYQDPYLSENTANKTVLLGLKGASYADAGAVYAPYVPFQMTDTFTNPNDFTSVKGIRTRYGKKMLRPEYYGTLTVSGLPT